MQRAVPAPYHGQPQETHGTRFEPYLKQKRNTPTSQPATRTGSTLGPHTFQHCLSNIAFPAEPWMRGKRALNLISNFDSFQFPPAPIIITR